MKEKEKLTERILEWQRTGKGFEGIIRDVSLLTESYLKCRKALDPDLRAEFYCYFYEKMLNLIRDFSYEGKPFQALLFHTVRWHLSTFYRRMEPDRIRKMNIINYEILKFEERDENPEVCGLELEPEASVLLKVDSESGCIRDELTRKKLTILLLKGAFFADDRYIEAVSKLTGESSEKLHLYVQELRRKGISRKNRLERFNLRRNKAYIGICGIHTRISGCHDSAERGDLFDRLGILKKRMNNACMCAESVRLWPTNSEIAQTLGIKPNQVENGLRSIKRRLREYQ